VTPEQQARVSIDALLTAAGWHVCNLADANIHAGSGAVKGVAIREFPLNPGFGVADYLPYANGKAAGVIEAKKQGTTLTGVELQSARYAQGLPASLPAWVRPLPFSYESTGIETHFTQGLDPAPRARAVFAFHQPATLAGWLQARPAPAATLHTGHAQAQALSAQDLSAGFATQNVATNLYGTRSATLLGRLQTMPPLIETGLWQAQITAIRNLEISLRANKPRALIQMATGSGKTFTSISAIYRQLRFGDARRVLFLVDRGNLARQTQILSSSPVKRSRLQRSYKLQRTPVLATLTVKRSCWLLWRLPSRAL